MLLVLLSKIVVNGKMVAARTLERLCKLPGGVKRFV